MSSLHTILKRVIIAKLLLKIMLFTPTYLNNEKRPEMIPQSPAAYYQIQKKTTYDLKYDLNEIKRYHADRCDADAKAGELEEKLIPQKAYTANPAPSPASRYVTQTVKN